ncbi:hypothetical protein BGZ60DRAFT_559315 [Tricladium varicosporioides]|nr:hypothetical protein BGZ60DRAFT_559315 [Hymenoscyphus varicosporioides]
MNITVLEDYLDDDFYDDMDGIDDYPDIDFLYATGNLTLDDSSDYDFSNTTSNSTLDDSFDFDLIEKRASPPVMEPGTPVKKVTIDCVHFDKQGSLEDICNIDCYAILCLERPTHLQYNNVQSNQRGNRVTSGHDLQPFKSANLKKFKTTRFGASYTSPEEFPFASTNNGGSGLMGTKTRDAIKFNHQAIVAGVLQSGQSSQGRALKTAYANAKLGNKKSPIRQGDWYDLMFKSNAKYCKGAFPKGKLTQASKASRNSFCAKQGKGGKDPVNRVYVKTTPKGSRAPKFEPAVRGKGKFRYLA